MATKMNNTDAKNFTIIGIKIMIISIDLELENIKKVNNSIKFSCNI